MALVLADRVQETTTTIGTGSVTLGGAVLGYQTFAVVGNGNTTFYTIADQGGSNWEVGVGTYSTTGPTLSRDTVLASSSGGSLVNFTSGTKAVFVTYPSEKSVNLDGSGNVSALGTVSSGTWQGSTVGVAYGGTGVTASSGANSVVLRDSNQNIKANRIAQSRTSTAAVGGTTALTVASSFVQTLTGTGTQTYTLPDATTLDVATWFLFDNDATGNLVVKDFSGSTLDTVASGGYSLHILEANSTVAGYWIRAGLVPSEVNWGTNNLDLGGSTTITNGTWQGNPVGVVYGGTGLNAIAAANYALYSSAPNTVTAGTLPVAAGGTGSTTLTANNVLLGNGTSALQVVAPGASGNILTSNGTTWTSAASTAATADQAYFLSFMMG